MAALRAPTAAGLKLTENVVLPAAATEETTGAVTVSWPGLLPSLVIAKPVRAAVPTFLRVNVRLAGTPTTTEPKPLVPPSAMSVATGCSTAISGAATTEGVQTIDMLVKFGAWFNDPDE